MRKVLIAAAALAMVGVAGNASAQTSVGANVTVNTTWGAGANQCPIILQNVVFVTSGATLTILPGCVVRGQPREGPIAGGPATAPGALVITQNGRINAVGQPNNPIIFTTAATDNNNDNVADSSGGFLEEWNPGDTFLDDSPLAAPLAPLDGAGNGNVLLWGGLVLLGDAPTNLANNNPAANYGEGTIEGLLLPGFPVPNVTYGGRDPHDSSGTLQFVSVRHAGDPILEANELNCITLGGVGDGTILDFVECYANFDDGFEWFGGTANGRHLVSHAIADDSFDVDQGYTGVNQFLLAYLPFFNENDGTSYGSPDTERVGEFDGDDAGDTNVRLDATDGDVNGSCWPLPNSSWFNITAIGSNPPNNPAVSPAGNRTGIFMRNGFAGDIYNSHFVNFGNGLAFDIDPSVGASGCVDDTIDHVNAGRIGVFASTFSDSGAVAGGTPEDTILDTGDALCNSLGATGNCSNGRNVGNVTLANENSGYNPQGNANGKLVPALLVPKLNPRILGTGFGALTANGVPPFLPGTDPTATYRGAFAASAGTPLWITGRALGAGPGSAFPGWTTLSNAGLIVP